RTFWPCRSPIDLTSSCQSVMASKASWKAVWLSARFCLVATMGSQSHLYVVESEALHLTLQVERDVYESVPTISHHDNQLYYLASGSAPQPRQKAAKIIWPQEGECSIESRAPAATNHSRSSLPGLASGTLRRRSMRSSLRKSKRMSSGRSVGVVLPITCRSVAPTLPRNTTLENCGY